MVILNSVEYQPRPYCQWLLSVNTLPTPAIVHLTAAPFAAALIMALHDGLPDTAVSTLCFIDGVYSFMVPDMLPGRCIW